MQCVLTEVGAYLVACFFVRSETICSCIHAWGCVLLLATFAGNGHTSPVIRFGMLVDLTLCETLPHDNSTHPLCSQALVRQELDTLAAEVEAMDEEESKENAEYQINIQVLLAYHQCVQPCQRVDLINAQLTPTYTQSTRQFLLKTVSMVDDLLGIWSHSSHHVCRRVCSPTTPHMPTQNCEKLAP